MFVTLARTSLFLGTFPYKYDVRENVLNFSYFGAIMSVISSIINIYLIVNLFMKIAAGTTYFNPQTCLLCFIYGSITIMIFFRILRRKPISKLFEEVLKYHNTRHPEVYKVKKWVLWFVLLYMLMESLAVLFSLITVIPFQNLDWLAAINMMITFLLPVAFIILIPVSLENQYSVCCTILAEAFDTLNEQLDKMVKKFDENGFENELKIFMENRSEIMRTVKLLNREYGLELFLLSNTILMVAVYVSNDMILMINYITIDSALYWYKIMFNFYSLGGLAIRLCWICYETEQLTLKIKNTEKVILKYDINGLPEKVYIKLEKYLKQLNTPPDDTAICGFFHLNMEFVFNTFGTVIAFVVIFAQLNFSEKWIQ